MNRIYRLVWNRSLRLPQVASELARSSSSASGTRVARIAPALRPLALAVGLAMVSSTAWGACSPNASDIPSCSAAGGAGIPQRTGSGGAGNGSGGGASVFDSGTGATVQVTGAPAAANGVGGAGADGESPGGVGGSAGTIGGGTLDITVASHGGVGGSGPNGFNFASGGGGGGAGVTFSSAGVQLNVDNGATVTGGTGGAGGNGTSGSASNGAGGGGGGAGVLAVADNADIQVDGQVTGGSGGVGGSGGNNGGGGAGGDGLLELGQNTSTTNSGSIAGGDGGAAGTGSADNSAHGGSGGAGVNLVGQFATLQNEGSITGGTGAIGGQGGTGVVTWDNNTIVNGAGGSISGGLNPDGSTALAIQFHGTGNALTMFNGSSIVGGIDLAAGAQARVFAQDVNMVLDNAITLGAGATITGDMDGADGLQFSGPISGSGALAVTGSGTLTLSGTDTYTGGTSIASGASLQVGNGGTTGTIVGDVHNQGTLIYDRSDTVSLGGVIDGSGNLVQAGTGTLVLSGVNTYTGSTSINAGTLALSGNGSIASSSGVAVNGSFDISGTTTGASVQAISGAGNILLGGKTLTLTNASGSFDGSIAGSGGLTIGGGTQTVSGVQAYTGATAIASGATLALSGLGSIAASGGLVNDGVFDISATSNGASIRALTGGGTVDLGAQNLTLSQASGAFNGTIVGAGGVEIAGGTQTLGAINTYGGATRIDSGATLALAGAASIVNSSGVTSNGTFDISGTTGASIQQLSGSGAVQLGAQTLFVLNAASNFGGAIAGTGGFTVTGGAQFLSGINTYTGLTKIGAGAALALSGGGSIAASSGVVADGLFDIAGATGGASIASLSGVGSGQVNLGQRTLTLTQAAGNFAGAIGGTGGLVVSGGTLTLGGVNSYTGDTQIQQGATLALAGAGSIASSAAVIDNGTFDISATSAGAAVNKLIGSGAVKLGGRQLTLAGNATFDGVISGNGGSLAITGRQTLSSAQSYSGATTVSGQLALVGNGSIQSSSGLVLAHGVFDISGTSTGATIANLSGSGSVNMGQQGLTLLQANGTFDGSIAGSGGLLVNNGTLTLTGSNTYTGDTRIVFGKLVLAGSGSLASQSIWLGSAGARLDIAGASAPLSITTLTGLAGTHVDIGANTLNVSGGSFNGQFTGTGALNKQGGSALVLDADSSAFTGKTTVEAGVLVVGNSLVSSGVLGGDVLVRSQGSLSGHGTVNGSVVNNGLVRPGGSIGTLTLGGNYTQTATGTLAIEVSPTDVSLLKVGGNANLGGGLALTYDPGTYTARQYTILSTGGSVSGTFGSVTNTYASGAALGTLAPTVTYGANQVGLTLATPTTPTPPSGPTVIAPTQTSNYAALGTAALLRAQAANASLLERALLDDKSHRGDGLWVTASGAGTDIQSRGGQPGFHMDQYGLMMGVDRPLGDATVGAAAGFSHSNLRENVTGDTAQTDTVRLALYGTQPLGAVRLSGTLGYAFDDLSQKRDFGSIGVAEGDHVGHEFTAAVQAAMPVAVGGGTLTPGIGARYAYFHGNAFGEDGARGQNLRVGVDSARSLQPYVGLAFDRSFDNDGKPLDLQLRAGYATETAGRRRGVTVAAQDGTLFAAPGTELPRSYATLGASLAMHPTRASTLSLSYDALLNVGHASAQAASVTFSYRF